MSKQFRIGYTTGVYDLFHIGHLNILKKSKETCDYLIVGVTKDEDVVKIKNKLPVIPFEERVEIVQAIHYVNEAVPEINPMNKLEAWKAYRFDVIFKGDDWKVTSKWKQYENDFSELGVHVVYFPYTKGTSSTLLTKAINKFSDPNYIVKGEVQ
jgi:glycerol-3-phosphate cytidylyltransferase